jgi:type I restriction enzyme R subunit
MKCLGQVAPSDARPWGEVVLIPRLRAALERLNPQLPADAIASAVDESYQGDGVSVYA